jgi:hypothetical protein
VTSGSTRIYPAGDTPPVDERQHQNRGLQDEHRSAEDEESPDGDVLHAGGADRIRLADETADDEEQRQHDALHAAQATGRAKHDPLLAESGSGPSHMLEIANTDLLDLHIAAGFAALGASLVLAFANALCMPHRTHIAAGRVLV